ncbi:hypothetical protein ACLB2K_072639 [Fragaria x ananassa]
MKGMVWATAEDLARNRGRVLSLYRQILRSINSPNLPLNLAARLAKKAEVRAIFMLASEERSLHNIEDLSDAADYSLSLMRKGEIPKVLRDHRVHPSKALRYGHNSVTCNGIARVLGQAYSIQDFWSVIEEFEGCGQKTWILILKGGIMLSRSILASEKLDLVEHLRLWKCGFEPDTITYTLMVYGLRKAKKLVEAYIVLDNVEENGCVPDIKTWTILIQGHCSASEIDKALICFAKMMEIYCEAHGDVLDALLKGFIKQMKVDGCIQTAC